MMLKVKLEIPLIVINNNNYYFDAKTFVIKSTNCKIAVITRVSSEKRGIRLAFSLLTKNAKFSREKMRNLAGKKCRNFAKKYAIFSNFSSH